VESLEDGVSLVYLAREDLTGRLGAAVKTLGDGAPLRIWGASSSGSGQRGDVA
jgi:hypothetical protein